VRPNSSVLTPSSQYMELGYTMKFLCSFSGSAECLYVTGAVLSAACKRQKGVESTAAGSDETKQRIEWCSQCCRKKSSNCYIQCMWNFQIVWYLPIYSVKERAGMRLYQIIYRFHYQYYLSSYTDHRVVNCFHIIGTTCNLHNTMQGSWIT
jgi:hypothetical protein